MPAQLLSHDFCQSAIKSEAAELIYRGTPGVPVSLLRARSAQGACAALSCVLAAGTVLLGRDGE